MMKPLNRRNLLVSGAAAAVATTLPRLEAQSSLAKAVGVFTVRAGEGRPGAQWSVHGEKAFSTKVSGADVGRSYAAVEVHTPPGLGPELHTHPGQNELIYMLTGSIGMQCGSTRTLLKAGDTFMIPANDPHAYVTLGTQSAHMLIVYDPAGDIEGFFAEYASLLNVVGEPDHRKVAAVFAKHGMKVLGPPLQASSFAS